MLLYVHHHSVLRLGYTISSSLYDIKNVEFLSFLLWPNRNLQLNIDLLWPDVQFYVPYLKYMYQLTSLDTGINELRSMCLTRLPNRGLFWHPELSPFLSSTLLVIIALTLSVKEINQNDFFKVNGCKESKRGRGKKNSHTCSKSSIHERQGQAQMQRTSTLIYSWSAAAEPARWQRGQGHELEASSHPGHLISFNKPTGFPDSQLKMGCYWHRWEKDSPTSDCTTFLNSFDCEERWHQMRILTHVLLLPTKNHRKTQRHKAPLMCVTPGPAQLTQRSDSSPALLRRLSCCLRFSHFLRLLLWILSSSWLNVK